MDGPTTVLLFVGLLLPLVVLREKRAADRRTAANRALHELRRPLQVLALSGPGPPRTGTRAGSTSPLRGACPASTLPLWQAIRALGDLDRELNGKASAGGRDELIACRLMADSCVRRWRSRARLAGAGIELRWIGPDALLRGDGATLAGALENLLSNAIEHGGPAITVNALTVGRRLRIEVLDNGRSHRRDAGAELRSGAAARLRGTGRHGHGLQVVERTVSEHGGRFELELGEAGSKAVMVLPVGAPASRGRRGIRVNW
ncbi:MAG: ATP-binding protein [Acidobacteriota bacterium]|jgi:hypothetical protein